MLKHMLLLLWMYASACSHINSKWGGNQLRNNTVLILYQVYTFGPTFRAENSNTSRHLAEFWVSILGLAL